MATLLEPKTLREMSRVHPSRNLALIALDYLTAAAIITATILFFRWSDSAGFPSFTKLAVGIIGAILVSCVQHRIALMGHEASHYMLHPDRRANDLLAEVLCFSPIFASLTQYRAKHLGHHLYPNEPGKDPNMAGSRAARLYARFPMPKPSFIYQYYLKFFWPPFVLHNLLDLVRVVSLGQGLSPIASNETPGSRHGERGSPGRFCQNTSLLGALHVLLIIGANQVAKHYQSFPLLLILAGAILTLSLIVWRFLPADWFARGRGKLAYQHKTSALYLLILTTLFFGGLCTINLATGFDAGFYFVVLWVPGLVYITPYLMLLREVYQHANAGQGELTNSRVMHADPFTRWALLGYGNDIHLVHHIYPNLPHYRLGEAHSRMKRECPDYDRHAEETFGTVSAGESGRRSLLDALAAEVPFDHPSIDSPLTRQPANQ